MGCTHLSGERVQLREYALEDADLVAQTIRETPSLARWVPEIARHRSVASVRLAFEAMQGQTRDGHKRVFGVWHSGSGEFLGEAGLYRIDRRQQAGEIGYWLRESARGRGFATESLGLLVNFACGALGLTDLEAHVGVENAPSQAVLERCGFHVVGSRAVVLPSDAPGAAMLIYRFVAA